MQIYNLDEDFRMLSDTHVACQNNILPFANRTNALFYRTLKMHTIKFFYSDRGFQTSIFLGVGPGPSLIQYCIPFIKEYLFGCNSTKRFAKVNSLAIIFHWRWGWAIKSTNLIYHQSL